MAAVVIDSALPRRSRRIEGGSCDLPQRSLSRNSPRGRADVPMDSNEDGLTLRIEDGEDEEKGKLTEGRRVKTMSEAATAYLKLWSISQNTGRKPEPIMLKHDGSMALKKELVWGRESSSRANCEPLPEDS